MEASSGTIELDIGMGGQFLDSQKLSTTKENIEMKLFITRNQEFLDWNEIVQVKKENLDAFMPPFPSIPFVENNQDEDSSYYSPSSYAIAIYLYIFLHLGHIHLSSIFLHLDHIPLSRTCSRRLFQ